MTEGKSFFDARPALCDVLATLCLVVCCTALYSIGGMSFNQYIHICHPHLYMRWVLIKLQNFSKKKTIKLYIGPMKALFRHATFRPKFARHRHSKFSPTLDFKSPKKVGSTNSTRRNGSNYAGHCHYFDLDTQHFDSLSWTLCIGSSSLHR